MKIMLWRALLVISLMGAGFLGGGFVGGTWFVAKGSGLAGGAMVLGYAVLGVIVFAGIGLVAAKQLSSDTLPRAAMVVFALVAALTAWLVISNRPAGEPDSAFAPAGIFSAAMDRLDLSDPYLFTKVEIDSRARTFVQTGPAPDHVIYYADMKARNLVDIRNALNNVIAMTEAEFADCKAAQGPAIKRLSWDIEDPQNTITVGKTTGIVDASAACLAAHSHIARALFLIEKASSDPAGKVRKQ